MLCKKMIAYAEICNHVLICKYARTEGRPCILAIRIMKKKTKSLAYSFTLPAETLLIIYLEVKQKKMIIGTIEIATAKYVAP